MDALTRLTVEGECTALSAKFAFFVDQRRYDDLMNLFAEDGEFTRPDLSVRGREQMKTWLNSRPADMVTRHVSGPTVFESVGVEEARACTYVTVYQGTDEGKPILPLNSPKALIEYHDTFRKTAAGWRIASRTVKPIMLPGA